MTESLWMVLSVALPFAAGLFLWAGLRQRDGSGKNHDTVLNTLSAASRKRLNATVYRDQTALLQQRHADGDLNNEELEREQYALDTNLKADLQAVTDWKHQTWGLARVALLFGFVLATTGLIWVVSNGQQHLQISAAADETPRSIEDMVQGLEQRLQSEPNDVRGWAMLGRSYSVLERHAKAATAYARANQLSGSGNPALLVAQAEAMGMAQEQRLSGEPQKLLLAALAIDPHNIQALWYALIAASQMGDAASKASLLDRLAAEPELPEPLAELMRSEFGYNFPDAVSTALSFEIEVQVPDAVRAQLPADAILFVFARAQNGPPMPLAVSRKALPSSWPVRIKLDDTMSMMPGQNLSAHKAWTVVARISASGQAQAQSGDWQAQVDLSAPPSGPIQLSIEQQIP